MKESDFGIFSRRGIRRKIALANAFALCACGSRSDSAAQANRNDVASYKPIDGYNDYKLGSSFEDVLQAGALEDLFNPVGLQECFKDLALKGCSLTPKSDDTVFDMRNGIPYALDLTFDRQDKLANIALKYHRDGTISTSDCTALFGRTVDWVAKDYGPFDFRRSDDPPNAYKNSVMHTSPGGTKFATLPADKDGFVSQFLHNVSDGAHKVNRNGQSILEWSRPHAGLFYHYTNIGGGICDIDVNFAAADARK